MSYLRLKTYHEKIAEMRRKNYVEKDLIDGTHDIELIKKCYLIKSGSTMTPLVLENNRFRDINSK